MKAGKEKIEATREACVKSMEPTSLESELEHEEVHKEEAVVKIVTAPKKPYRDQPLALKRHSQPKKRTQGNGGSQKKLAATCRGMT
jgi:hypothetical protein